MQEWVHLACARVVVEVEMQAQGLLHGIWISFSAQWNRPVVAEIVAMVPLLRVNAEGGPSIVEVAPLQ